MKIDFSPLYKPPRWMAVTDCGGLRVTPDEPPEEEWAWGVLDKLTEQVSYMPTDKANAEYIE